MGRHYQQIVREVVHHLSNGANICSSAFVNTDKGPPRLQQLYSGLNFRSWSCPGVNEDDQMRSPTRNLLRRRRFVFEYDIAAGAKSLQQAGSDTVVAPNQSAFFALAVGARNFLDVGEAGNPVARYLTVRLQRGLHSREGS